MTRVERPVCPAADHVRSLAALDERRAARLADWIELTKPGIVRMVLVTTAVGFILAALPRAWDMTALLLVAAACMLGTALSAAGANALNMAIEVRRDAAMLRTMRRPIPANRITVHGGVWVGVGLSVAGVGLLWIGCNPWAGAVSAVTILTYVLAYTPLKPVTPLATIIGAFPGALPPLIGWAAGSGDPFGGLTQMGGWSLFAIIFVWQIPHFLAIAWKYRDEYAAAGHKVLPVLHQGGARTSRAVLLWSVALIPVSLAPVMAIPGRIGLPYLIIALACGIGMLWFAVRLARDRSDGSARRLFFASIAYLPVVLFALVVDALARLALT